ncbi:Uncharacterized protein TCM_032174 [Theobroma cacao]|uniref:RNase H type-1 domain-containing protein n=1 Tax=Theobroma cacao TaxID=3641 RepID=A0A061F9J5_THECC|nr:Uncharacterized protein TCM_032174 [Theobroma cacao]
MRRLFILTFKICLSGKTALQATILPGPFADESSLPNLNLLNIGNISSLAWTPSKLSAYAGKFCMGDWLSKRSLPGVVLSEWIQRRAFSAKDFELTKLQAAWWANAKRLDHNISIGDLTRSPNAGTTPARCKQTSNTISWSKSPVGSLNFNTDKPWRGCPGDSGIGGILRNEHGDVLILFSKSLGSPNKVPWRLRQLIAQTLNILGKIKKWDIKHILRLANNEADALAKEGVLRTIDFLWSLDVGSAQQMESWSTDFGSSKLLTECLFACFYLLSIECLCLLTSLESLYIYW